MANFQRLLIHHIRFLNLNRNIKKYNANPVGLLIGLDRQEKGSLKLSAKAELKKEFGVEVFSVINLDDLIAYMDDKNYQSQQKLMQNYRSEWGA